MKEIPRMDVSAFCTEDWEDWIWSRELHSSSAAPSCLHRSDGAEDGGGNCAPERMGNRRSKAFKASCGAGSEITRLPSYLACSLLIF